MNLFHLTNWLPTDKFGRDVKLASGNVCSRIIPIKIHDLDASDTELIREGNGLQAQGN